MAIGEVCIREVVIASREESVDQLAKLMRERHVGDVLIVDDVKGERAPVGIVTDRDIVVGVIAAGVSPGDVLAEEVMSSPLMTVKESDGVFETIQVMHQRGVRRLPVIDQAGALIGIVTLDDMLGLFADELSALAKVVRREKVRETVRRVEHASAQSEVQS